MKPSIRVLFFLIFIGLIFPKFLSFWGVGDPQKIKNIEEGVFNEYKQNLDEQIGSLQASLDAIDIRDEGFKDCLQDEVRVYESRGGVGVSGKIDDIKQIEILDCSGWKIQSLYGVQELTKLKRFTLYRNDIRSLEPLRDHPSLEAFDFDSNRNLDSLSALNSISTLSYVNFPRMDKEYCPSMQKIVEKMEYKHGKKARSNISNVCR